MSTLLWRWWTPNDKRWWKHKEVHSVWCCRFICADQARKLATMSREERKKATVEYYHKLYASKEALKVSFFVNSVLMGGTKWPGFPRWRKKSRVIWFCQGQESQAISYLITICIENCKWTRIATVTWAGGLPLVISEWPAWWRRKSLRKVSLYK